jgi:hypothetical protein
MHDDTSAISSAACNTLVGSRTIESFENGQLKTYVFNGGRWFLEKTEGVEQGTRLEYNCVDVSALNTYAVLEPAYKGAAFALAVAVLALCLKLIFGSSLK